MATDISIATDVESETALDRSEPAMKLHCLGTAGYHPNEHRHTSTYFIPECGLLLDAGSGTFRVRNLIERPDISILLSHAHLDHVLGLTYFLEFFAVTSLKTVHVYAERNKIEAIRHQLFHELLFPVEPRFHWHPLEDEGSQFEIGGAICHWFPMPHPGGSVGFRLEWPQVSLGYITDTTSTPESSFWGELGQVDLLVHECNFPDEAKELAIRTGHSWTSAVLEGAIRHKMRRITLTHLDPSLQGLDPLGLANILTEQPVQTKLQVEIANDSLVIDLLSL